MRNQQTAQNESVKGSSPVSQAERVDLIKTLRSISRLQTTLAKLALLLDDESVEILVPYQKSLKEFSDIILQVTISPQMNSDKYQLGIWENEGGKIEYDISA